MFPTLHILKTSVNVQTELIKGHVQAAAVAVKGALIVTEKLSEAVVDNVVPSK